MRFKQEQFISLSARPLNRLPHKLLVAMSWADPQFFFRAQALLLFLG